MNITITLITTFLLFAVSMALSLRCEETEGMGLLGVGFAIVAVQIGLLAGLAGTLTL